MVTIRRRCAVEAIFGNLLRFARREIFLDVELREQPEKHDGVGGDVVRELPREIAVVVEHQLEAVGHDADELDHLEGGHVLLPPNVLAVLGTQSAEEVVEVHEHVDENVEKAEERGVAAGDEPGAGPDGERHDSVVDHVQEGNVLELLAGDEAEGVDEFRELAEVVQPTQVDHLQGFGAVRVVHGLATPAVIPSPSGVKELNKYVRTEHRLGKVVDQEEVLYIVGFSVLHEGRSPDFDDVDVAETEDDGREGTGHQRIVVHAGVPFLPHFVV